MNLWPDKDGAAIDRYLRQMRVRHPKTVIRSWLGHASLDTTNLYAQANIEAKRAASSGCIRRRLDGPAGSGKMG